MKKGHCRHCDKDDQILADANMCRLCKTAYARAQFRSSKTHGVPVHAVSQHILSATWLRKRLV